MTAHSTDFSPRSTLNYRTKVLANWVVVVAIVSDPI